jgi:ribonuclease P protein component
MQSAPWAPFYVCLSSAICGSGQLHENRMSAPFLSSHRLRKHADYQVVYKAGRKQFGKQMAYFYAMRKAPTVCLSVQAPTEGPRIGLTVPKALGKAVDRNRIKRRMREAVRHALPLLTAQVDVILHPKRSVREAEFALVEREVATIFRSVQAAAERSSTKAAQ